MRGPLRLALLLVATGAVAWLVVERPWRPPARTVVLISLDTLRPERLGVYGNDADVSPRIDALAREAVVFDQALAPAPWTLPSHMSMLTGLDPVAHGVFNAENRLSSRVTTLAQALQTAGFRTAAFTDGGFVKSHWGFGKGFEIYRDTVDPDGPDGFTRLLPEALDWLKSTRSEDRFIFLHTFDVHAPYQEGDAEVLARFRQRPLRQTDADWQLARLGFLQQQRTMRISEYLQIEELLNDYDAGVYEADRGVGQVLDLLIEQDALEHTLFIVTSDHGESFVDHGLHVGHGLGLTDDELRIPLVIRFPGREGAGTRQRTLVDLVDIAATVLEVMGLNRPLEMQGESLRGLVRREPRQRRYSLAYSQNTRVYALTEGEYKFIGPPHLPVMVIAKNHLGPTNPPSVLADRGEEYPFGHGEQRVTLRYDSDGDPLALRDVLLNRPQLYHRPSDPLEQHDLFFDEPELVKAMAHRLAELIEASRAAFARIDDGATANVTTDRQLMEQLTQLGYLFSSDASNPDSGELLASVLPKDLREGLTAPWKRPDDADLLQADRNVHFVRLRVAAGKADDTYCRKLLLEAGDHVAKWAAEHVQGEQAALFASRVVWRIEEILSLGQQIGVQLNEGRWHRVLEESIERHGPDGALPPAPAPPPP
ncbi:MAG: sulfatase [Planctomycetota bacterium]